MCTICIFMSKFYRKIKWKGTILNYFSKKDIRDHLVCKDILTCYNN